MNDLRRSSLVKPTLQTPFHIDFEWWTQHDSNWRVYLFSCLCPEHQNTFTNGDETTDIDWVDAETGRVEMVDGLRHVLMSHCSRQPEFLTVNTTLVDAVFRVLMASGNTPMSPLQLSEKAQKPAETILRTLTAGQIYKGIRPFYG